MNAGNSGETMGQAKLTNRVGTILKKEFREIFRDRRTLMSAVISPLLITPMLFGVMGIFISGQTEKAKTQTYAIGLVGKENAPTIIKALEAAPNIKLTEVPLEQAETEVKERRIHLALILPKDAESQLHIGRSVPLSLMFDEGDQNSQSAAKMLDAVFTKVGEKILEQRLIAKNLPTDYATPFKITEEPIKQGGSVANFLLSMLLPYILVISTFTGAIYAAFDQVAGEKERGTLETLLVSPASRRDIVLGKFGAVVGVCLISSVLTICGLVISFSMRSKAFEWLSKGGLHLGAGGVGVILLVLVPLSVLFAGILLAVSTVARNQKEAQTYIGPMMIVVLMPAMATVFIGADAANSTALIPIFNISIIIKQALSGSYNWTFILLAFAASASYAMIALALATRLFQKESVLIKA